LVFVQMTRTMPFRRTILQFSQIRRTLLLTFMVTSLSEPVRTGESVIVAETPQALKRPRVNGRSAFTD
jgi:hypothetical protein